MKEYLFVYRVEPTATTMAASPEEMQRRTKTWMDWVGGIAAKDRLASSGNRLTPSGKVLRPEGVVTDGPYTEIKETILGYTLVKADSYEEALDLAKGCPIFFAGGNVEVREIWPM